MLECLFVFGTVPTWLLRKSRYKILDNDNPTAISKLPLLSVLIFVRLDVSVGTSAVFTVKPPRLRDCCNGLSSGCGVSGASALYVKLALPLIICRQCK